MEAIDRVTHALESHGCSQKGNDWVCPSHADSTPSLSVNEGETGVVMRCHAGCTNEQVLNAVGLKMSDLFNEPLVKKERRREVAVYHYTDENNTPLYEVVRYEPKGFAQRKPDGTWGLNGTRRVLFRLPEVLAAIERGDLVYVVEGEKDVQAFEKKGLTATCSPAGAGKWRDEYSQSLQGARVVIIADKDEPGTKHAEQVAESLYPVAKSVGLFQARAGKDAHDHFAAGFDVDDFVPFTPVVSPDLVTSDDKTARVNPMWDKLLKTNDIDNIPSPVYVVDDLIVADSLAVIYGLPGSTKSFIGIDMALAIANNRPFLGKKVQGGDVLYVVAEGLGTFKGRKKAWQIENDVPDPDGVTWYPEPVDLLDQQQVDDLLDVCNVMQPVAIVLDTLSRCLPGQDENAPGPMTTAIENLDRIRRATRAAVIIIHHTPKDGSTPRGHSSLMGAVWTGIKITKNEDGQIKLEVEKQKHDEGISMEMRLRKVAVPGLEKGSAVLFVSEGWDRPNDISFSQMQLMKVIRENSGPEGISGSVLKRISGMPESTFHLAKTGLQKADKIRNIGSVNRPIWVPVDK